jgi:hypothetical protein
MEAAYSPFTNCADDDTFKLAHLEWESYS